MRIKSYFSSTVEGALSEARRELGPEAILIESRRSAPESRRLGAYEVVCALASPKPAGVETAANPPAPGRDTAKTAARPAASATVRPAEQLSHLNDAISGFLRRLDGLTRQLSRTESAALRAGASAANLAAIEALEAAEVDAHLIREVMNGVTGASGAAQTVAETLAARLKTDAQLGKPNAARKVVAVIGPPGAGKTTTLVKLAARYGVGARKPSLFLSIDTQRVGAAEPLRSYAAILGAGFQAVETPKALAQALAEFRGKEYIWIDTPGLSPREMDDAGELAALIAHDPDMDAHLVLPAPMRTADLDHKIGQFRQFRPAKLLFTRLDETASYGALLNAAERSGLPLSFLTDGPQIPEDLSEASGRAVARLILGGADISKTPARAAARAASAAA